MIHSFSTSPEIRRLADMISNYRSRGKCPKRLIAQIELERILFYADQLPEYKFSRAELISWLLDWKDGKSLFPHPKPRRKL